MDPRDPTGPTRRALLVAGGASVLAPRARAEAPAATLDIAVFPALDRTVQAALPAWRAAHPRIEIRIATREYADHHAAMLTALATGAAMPDVLAVEAGFIGRFAAGGLLADLREPPWNAAPLLDNFVPCATTMAHDRHGAVRALPADVGPGTQFFRADLLARAGIEPGRLAGPWDGWLAAGRQLKARTGACLVAHAQNVKDAVLRSALAPGEGLYFDHRGTLLVGTPRFVQAFELAQATRAQGLDAKLGTWSSDWAEALRRGTVATQMGGAWLLGHLSRWLAPATHGLWRAGPLPGRGHACWGGSFYALPRQGRRTPAAWDFLRLLTLDRSVQLQAARSQQVFPALRSALDDPFFEQPVDFLGGQKAWALWRAELPHIGAPVADPHDALAEEAVALALDAVLDGSQTVREALAGARTVIERRIAA